MALLVSLATALHVVEGLLPPLPLPGAKLGLANIATIIALRTLGFGPGVGVSILGAVAHSTAQIVTAVRILHHPGLWGYWPFLMIISAVTGLFVGVVSDRSLTLTEHWLTSREGAL